MYLEKSLTVSDIEISASKEKLSNFAVSLRTDTVNPRLVWGADDEGGK